MSDKAKRATISLGELEVDGFQMPDGSYRMSITGAAAAVNLTVSNASDFLRSKALKSILGKQSTPRIIDDNAASRHCPNLAASVGLGAEEPNAQPYSGKPVIFFEKLEFPSRQRSPTRRCLETGLSSVETDPAMRDRSKIGQSFVHSSFQGAITMT